MINNKIFLTTIELIPNQIIITSGKKGQVRRYDIGKKLRYS